MGDFLYGKLLGYVIVGVPILVFKIMRFALRIVWWLGLWAILSVGAGLMSITRAGKIRARPGRRVRPVFRRPETVARQGVRPAVPVQRD